jgi:hypothetical protein
LEGYKLQMYCKWLWCSMSCSMVLLQKVTRTDGSRLLVKLHKVAEQACLA